MKEPRHSNEAQRISAAIRDGDEAAFVSYYEERILNVASKVQKITLDRDEAWDIAQDTFIKLWQNRENIDPAKSLDTFLLKMAINTALDARKHKQTRARYYEEQMFLQNNEDLSADTKILSRELQRKIDLIISQMPQRQREVFLLSREEGLTHGEIAQRMGISQNTVKNHMVNALGEIRSVLSALALTLILN